MQELAEADVVFGYYQLVQIPHGCALILQIRDFL